MTTSAPIYSGTYSASAPARKLAQPSARFSLGGWFAVMSSALDMANAIPDNGRISAKQLAKVRAIAESI